MSNIAIFIPTLKKGGAEKQAVWLMNALGEEHRIFFILLYPELGVENELLQQITARDFRLVRLEGNFFRKIDTLYHILRGNKVAAIFCYLTQPDIWGTVVGRLAGVGLIYQGIRSTWLPASKLRAEKLAARFSTGVIINSYSGKKIFERLGLRNQIVIPNCYPVPQEFCPRPSKKKITIISVGRFVPEKDYRTALAAVAEMGREYPDFVYRIVGHGELESAVRAWIVEFGLSDRVDLRINPPDIMGLLCESDIYLSTSLVEGTSNAIMEAMDASLPIVATDTGDNKILVEEGRNGFLSPVRETHTLAAGLCRLASSSALRNEMGRQSNEILREKYSYETFKNSYLALLK